MGFQICCSRAQDIQIWMVDRQFDRRPLLVQRGLEANFFRVGNRAERLAQALSHLGGGQVARPVLRRCDIDPGTHFTIGGQRGAAHDHVALVWKLLAIIGLDFFFRLVQASPDVVGSRPGSALGQRDVHTDEITFDLGHETRRNPPCRHQHDGQCEYAHEDRNGGIALADCQGQYASINVARKPGQAVGNRGLDLQERGQGAGLLLRTDMSQVGRQDQKRLDQREGQCSDDHQRDLAGELDFRPGQQHPGRECHHRRDHSKYDRLCNHLHAKDRGRQAALTAFDSVVNILAHDDRVIYDHADHDQEGKEREEVQGDAEHRQHHECAGKGNCDAHRHPEGHNRPQE